MQGNVRQCSRHGDNGNNRGKRWIFAVSCGDEVRDGCDVLCLGNLDNPQDQWPPYGKHDYGSEINGDEVETRGRGQANAAEKRPGRAVDGKRESIDGGPTIWRWRACLAVSEIGHSEEKAQIQKGRGNDDPAVNHVP